MEKESVPSDDSFEDIIKKQLGRDSPSSFEKNQDKEVDIDDNL